MLNSGRGFLPVRIYQSFRHYQLVTALTKLSARSLGVALGYRVNELWVPNVGWLEPRPSLCTVFLHRGVRPTDLAAMHDYLFRRDN